MTSQEWHFDWSHTYTNYILTREVIYCTSNSKLMNIYISYAGVNVSSHILLRTTIEGACCYGLYAPISSLWQVLRSIQSDSHIRRCHEPLNLYQCCMSIWNRLHNYTHQSKKLSHVLVYRLCSYCSFLSFLWMAWQAEAAEDLPCAADIDELACVSITLLISWSIVTVLSTTGKFGPGGSIANGLEACVHFNKDWYQQTISWL